MQDRIGWRWHGASGGAGFGDPTTTTSYALCVYDAANALVASALAPAGASCGKHACWAKTKTGFRYADRRAATGVRALALATRGDETTCALVGGGSRTGVPATAAQTTPLTVQLVNGDGTCWTARFGSARKRGDRGLKATSD